MLNNCSPNVENPLSLDSAPDAPFPFKVRIASGLTENPLRAFEITGVDPKTGETQTIKYDLTDTQQASYQRFFGEIAKAFGTRVPRNLQVKDVPSFRAPYRVLLDYNVSPDILYGYGDPAVIRVEANQSEKQGACYYLVATSNDAPNSFPILRSADLQNWELVSFVFPKDHKPPWAIDGENVSDYWAPEMHELNGEFLVCFTARDKNRSLGIGLARSFQPGGPFTSGETPLIRGGAIDPHLFVNRRKESFLFWKEDSNDLWPSLLSAFLSKHGHLTADLFSAREDQRTASFIQTLWPWVQSIEPMERFCVQQILIETVLADLSGFTKKLRELLEVRMSAADQQSIQAILTAMRTPVYAQELDASTSKLIGSKEIVLENDKAWEGHLIEGIWVCEHNNRFYMFYSGNDFSTPEYGVGVAIADAPLGPYRKVEQPLLRSTAEWSGPGHPSAAIGLDGEPWLFLHGYFPGRAGYKEFRALLALPIGFSSDSVFVR